MKEGDLYFLVPTTEKYRFDQAMFPYTKGGKAMITKIERVKFNQEKGKALSIELVDFLFDGKIYTQADVYFKQNAIYIGSKG